MTQFTPIEEKAAKRPSRLYGLCGWQVLGQFDPEIEPLINEALFSLRHHLPNGWVGKPRAAWGYSLKQATI